MIFLICYLKGKVMSLAIVYSRASIGVQAPL
ncbi:hypothetical protein O1Q80_00091 [Lonepinella sp. MS14435]